MSGRNDQERPLRSGRTSPSAVFRTVQPVIWSFDCEWVPCAASGRRLLGLDPGTPEPDVFQAMWTAAGATPGAPRPFLKLAWCRVVSVAVVERRRLTGDRVSLALRSLGGADTSEADVVGPFLDGLARRRPQLVGFNSHAADLPVLRQRALVLGLAAPGLCARPEKPWQGPDYAHPYNEWNVDLLRALGGRRGAAAPRLATLAALCGIPAKALCDRAVSGADVAALWLAGRGDDVRRYNECDAVVTHLLWARAARLAGLLSPADYVAEEGRVEALLERRAAAGDDHLESFLQRWRTLPSSPVRTTDPLAA